VPAAQVEQFAAPADAENVPAAHVEQFAAPAAANVPAAQAAHARPPPACAVPPAHEAHRVPFQPKPALQKHEHVGPTQGPVPFGPPPQKPFMPTRRTELAAKTQGPRSVLYLSQHVPPAVKGFTVTQVLQRGSASHAATHAARLAAVALERSQNAMSTTPPRPLL
jgi:hypothetical protein